MKILLVDDEVEFVNTLSERLRMRGMQCTWVANGDQGLDKIKDENYDCVLLDYKMPGLSGIELIKAFKKERPEIKIIILTGHSVSSDLEQSLDMGVYKYLIKPVDIEKIISIIRGFKNGGS